MGGVPLIQRPDLNLTREKAHNDAQTWDRVRVTWSKAKSQMPLTHRFSFIQSSFPVIYVPCLYLSMDCLYSLIPKERGSLRPFVAF